MPSDDLIDETIALFEPRYGRRSRARKRGPMTPSWNRMYLFVLEIGRLQQDIPLAA